MNTRNKVKFLRERSKGLFTKYRKRDYTNIVGFRIDKKKTGNVEKNRYCVVFQVKKKVSADQLDTDKKLPSQITIKFPDGKRRKVNTDVEETGEFKLQSGVGGNVTSALSPPNARGSAGLFVTDDGVRTLMMTNYHVVAKNLMAQRRFYYRRQSSDNTRNVPLVSTTGQPTLGMIEEGRIGDEVDVAFIFLPDVIPHVNLNVLATGARIQGRVSNQAQGLNDLYMQSNHG
ncbi:MAG: hypothetical protein KF744_14500 [Taibaiella sp.]|nr:hypothetical protein [Taibaiella sp.]